jgi:recombination protein RecA
VPASILSYRPQEPVARSPGAPLVEQLPAGRLIEITAAKAGAQMTTAVACLRHAQQQGETAVWIQQQGGSLFPPDLHDSGIDLSALVIVNIPKTAGPYGVAKASELVLRSGGFGMVVLDLIESAMKRDVAWQGRLLSLAREHHAWLLLLSEGEHSGSLGPLVSLCIEPRRDRRQRGLFEVSYRVRKDKSGLLSGLVNDCRRGPWGLL